MATTESAPGTATARAVDPDTYASLEEILEVDQPRGEWFEPLDACPVCCDAAIGSAYRAEMKGVRLGYDACARCGYVFQNPRMSQEVLTAIYRSAWYWGLDDGTSGYQNYLDEGVLFKKEYRRRFAALSRRGLDPGGRLLDVGCGAGYSTLVARESGFDASGVEPSPAMVDFATKELGVPVHRGVIETFAAEPGSFQAVTTWGTAHNFRDPVEVFTRMRSLLAPGGWLATDFIDRDALVAKAMDGHFRRTINATGRPTKRSLRTLMERAGFRSSELVRHHPYFSLSHVLHFLPIKRLPVRRLESLGVTLPIPGYYLVVARA